MIVEPQADGTVNVRVGQYVPGFAIIFEAEAKPRLFGDLDQEKADRVIAGLSDEWRAVLTLAMGEPPDHTSGETTR